MPVAPLLEELSAQVHAGPSGPLRLVLRPPAGADALAAFQARMPLALTGSYPELLALSNGMSLYGIEVFGTEPPRDTNPENVADLIRRRLVPFHDWGNGDFDCLDLTKVVDAEPPVVYWNEEHENIFPIAHSLLKWIPMAVHEVSRFGRLLHPEDYDDARYTDAQGVYESIANVRKTFWGGPPIPDRLDDAPAATRKRDKLKQWFGARLRGR